MNEAQEVFGWGLPALADLPLVEDVVVALGVDGGLRLGMAVMLLFAMGKGYGEIRGRVGADHRDKVDRSLSIGLCAWRSDKVFRDQYERGLKIDKR